MLKNHTLCFYSHFMHTQHFTKYLSSPLINKTKAFILTTTTDNISPGLLNSTEFKHCLVLYVCLYLCLHLCACCYVHHVYTCLTEARRGCWNSWSWRWRQLSDVGPENWTPGPLQEQHPFNHPATSLASCCHFFENFLSFIPHLKSNFLVNPCLVCLV